MSQFKFKILQIKELDFTKLNKVISQIYKRNLPSEFTLWKYKDYPDGPPAIATAWDGSILVALQSIFPIKIAFGKSTFNGALFMDVGTIPKYRGKGLFKKVVELAEDYVLKKGGSFIITFPNEISYPLFFKKLKGWVPINNLVFLGFAFFRDCKIKNEHANYEKNLIFIQHERFWGSWLSKNPYLEAFKTDAFFAFRMKKIFLNLLLLLDISKKNEERKRVSLGSNLLKALIKTKSYAVIFLASASHPLVKQLSPCFRKLPVPKKFYFIFKPLKKELPHEFYNPLNWAISWKDWDISWGG